MKVGRRRSERDVEFIRGERKSNSRMDEGREKKRKRCGVYKKKEKE